MEEVMRKLILSKLLAAGAACALTACGGGGGGSTGLASTPTPPPPPPPPASAAVAIFPSPSTQEFAVVGIGASIRIRYDAATNRYEVMPGAGGWKTLVDDPNSSPLPGNPNVNFVFAGAPVNQSFFMIRAHYDYPEPERYRYSNLAAWGGDGLGGTTAFGMATPAGSVPVSGSATYNGMIEGWSSEVADFGDWGLGQGGISGSIKLAFNFGSGTLGGSISPRLDLATSYSLPTLAFKETVYSAGSTNFSGKFDTAVGGTNSFSGLFTGPNANELIGKFAFPYLSPVDGKAAQASGAFIAK